jgi:hypothetical protein
MMDYLVSGGEVVAGLIAPLLGGSHSDLLGAYEARNHCRL